MIMEPTEKKGKQVSLAHDAPRNRIKGKSPLLDGAPQSERQQLRHLLALGRLKEARSVVEQSPENVKHLVSLLDDPARRITLHSKIVLNKIIKDGVCLNQIIDELKRYILKHPKELHLTHLGSLRHVLEDAEDRLLSPDFERIRKLLAKCQQRKAKAIVKERPENLQCLLRLTARHHERDASERAAQVLSALAEEGWQVAEIPKALANFISRIGVTRFLELQRDSFGRVLVHAQKQGVDVSCVFLTLVNTLVLDKDPSNRIAVCEVLLKFAQKGLDISPTLPSLIYSAETGACRHKPSGCPEICEALRTLWVAFEVCDISSAIPSIVKIAQNRGEVNNIRKQTLRILVDWYISKKDIHAIERLIEDDITKKLAVDVVLWKFLGTDTTYEKRKLFWFDALIAICSRKVMISIMQHLEEEIGRMDSYWLDQARDHLERIIPKINKDAPWYREMREALIRIWIKLSQRRNETSPIEIKIDGAELP